MALIVALILVCAHQWDRNFLTAGKNISTVCISPIFWKSNLNIKCFGSFVFVPFLTVVNQESL